MNAVQEIFSDITCMLILVAVILYGCNKITELFKLNKEEQKEAALKIIKEELLKIMSDAEINWANFEKSGKLKRAEVIAELYQRFPVLKEIKDQETLIQDIDKMIEDTKLIMDEILKHKKEEVIIE